MQEAGEGAATVVEYFPEGQAVHVAMEEAPTAVEYVPAMQARQKDALVADV